MIRAILFDLDGTLVDRDGALRRYALDLFDRHPETFPPGRRDRDLASLIDGSVRDRRQLARRVAAAYPGLDTARDLESDMARRLPTFIEPDPELNRLLDRLATRYTLAVVSNGAGPLQFAKLAAAGLAGRIDGVFVSGMVGVGKPDPRSFLRALDWARVTPKAALFVGDDPVADIAGAARVGMKTCWVSRGRVYPEGPPRPDMTIDNVRALPEALT
ncbi:HAD family hydrolase [Aquisphaera insulae]|uniref:HAD family hydrolase n=1 Tax=Aquisphaera insulae TaxID=2712864 RepID=UPI0013EB866F|nr:HAD family hydrolase [Aquisphaera insulae]